MAKVRTLDISTLGNIDLKFARQIKPISAKQFEMLPLDKQEAFRTLFDQAYTIWEKQDLYENVQTYGSAKPATELFDLLEPYKTRDFANYPAPLKEKLLDLYSQDTIDAKTFDFLLWFIDKKYLFDQKLPKEIQNFVNRVYQKNIDYLRGNDQLFMLVRNVKKLFDSNIGFGDFSAEVQGFVRQCYLHCVSQQQITLNNKKMRAIFTKNGYDFSYAYSDFNRAFVGLTKIDYTSELSNPAQKLKLEYMLDYENMQNNFVTEFRPGCQVERLGANVAYNLGLKTLYMLDDDFYRYSNDATIPAHIEYFQDEYGYRRSTYKPTERDYKKTIGTTFASLFSDMLNFDIAQTLPDNDRIGQQDQQSALRAFVSIYNKQFSNKSLNMFKRIAIPGTTMRDTFGQNIYATAAKLLDPSNILGNYQSVNITDDPSKDFDIEDVENEPPKSSKTYIRNRMQVLEERFKNHPNDFEAVQEYMDLEDQLRSAQEGEEDNIDEEYDNYEEDYDYIDHDTKATTEEDMRERLQELDEILMKDPKNWEAMQEYYDIEDKLKNLEEQKEME